MTIERWEQPALTVPGRDVVDGWATQVAAVASLAARIAGTDFVPRGYRGSDAAVTAAILFGREVGVGPMTALQGIYVINGSVAMRAQLMRALVLRRGHTLVIRDWTSASCTLVGRRVDGTEDTPVTWTTEDARRARLSGPAWTAYPRAMLLARATGELCRAIFADVIGGMTLTVEEAEDLPAAEPNGTTPATRQVRRTVKAPPPGPGIPPAPDTAVAPEDPRPPAPPPVAGDLPPLPEDTMPPPAPAGPQNGAETAERPTPDQPATHDPDEPLSGAQRTNLFRLFGEAGHMEPRADRIHTVTGLVGRRVESFNELTRAEATRVIDTMTMAAQSGDPAALDVLITAGWERIEHREDPPVWGDLLEGTEE